MSTVSHGISCVKQILQSCYIYRWLKLLKVKLLVFKVTTTRNNTTIILKLSENALQWFAMFVYHNNVTRSVKKIKLCFIFCFLYCADGNIKMAKTNTEPQKSALTV